MKEKRGGGEREKRKEGRWNEGGRNGRKINFVLYSRVPGNLMKDPPPCTVEFDVTCGCTDTIHHKINN